MLRTAAHSIRSGVNIEITNKCKIKCPACPRQTNKKNLVGSSCMPLEQLKPILNTFPVLSFCGQMSDPIYHPEFQEVVEYIPATTEAIFHTCGHGFDEEWWTRVFTSAKDKRMRFVFGVDGLPKDSHQYRVGQDGEQVWEMMKLGSSMGVDIEWQYIVFNYNENDIEEARAMAAEHNITFAELHSNRFEHIEHLRPSEGFYVD